jgi:hypothetical protein
MAAERHEFHLLLLQHSKAPQSGYDQAGNNSGKHLASAPSPVGSTIYVDYAALAFRASGVVQKFIQEKTARAGWQIASICVDFATRFRPEEFRLDDRLPRTQLHSCRTN